MRNTQATCYGNTVSNQSPHLPMLISAAEPTTLHGNKTSEDDSSRSLRLFGRRDVKVSVCGGPCVKLSAIEMAFGDVAVAL